MFQDFLKPGKASFIIGGQWGSEGKGAVAAYLGRVIAEDRARLPAVVTTNAGAQAGHTSTHKGHTHVVFHLPTVPLILAHEGLLTQSFLNAGAIIDPDVFHGELEALPRHVAERVSSQLFIHPNAAVITDDCKAAEWQADSAQTKIASTRKGVGEALARKVLRSGLIAEDCEQLTPWVLSNHKIVEAVLVGRFPVLVEVPQGVGLSINERFYPHCTSRNCTVMQAMSDACIHPHQYGDTILVLRTYPIRVGNITASLDQSTPAAATRTPLPSSTKVVLGQSGGCYADQREISWADLGVEPEITTVTKRVRRVFTWSNEQAYRALQLTRPSHIQLTFCDYPGADLREITGTLRRMARNLGMDEPKFLYQYGPTTDDVYPEIK